MYLSFQNIKNSLFIDTLLLSLSFRLSNYDIFMKCQYMNLYHSSSLIFTPMPLKSEHFGLTLSLLWLFMFWFLLSPGYQQPCNMMMNEIKIISTILVLWICRNHDSRVEKISCIKKTCCMMFCEVLKHHCVATYDVVFYNIRYTLIWKQT